MSRPETPPGRRRSAVLLCALAVALAALVLGAGWTRVEVRGPSMTPTLRAGDRLLVRRGRGVRPGEIVVVRAPDGREAVKRLSARGGTSRPGDPPGGELGPGTITVLGDNPPASTDTRHWGPLPLSALRGRAVAVYHPPERARMLPRAPREVTPRCAAGRGRRRSAR